MKLSEIKGARTFDVIANIIEPIANIADDKKLAGLFKKENVPQGVDPRPIVIKRLKNHAPHLLKSHKADLMAIMAAIEGVNIVEYESELTLAKLTKDCTDIFTDEAFIALFTSAQSGKPSGSASMTSEGKA